MESLSSLCELFVVTQGSKGSLIINKEQIEVIKATRKEKIIDTTGAGDIYAGGFIHGLIKNYSLKKCGEIGSICAGTNYHSTWFDLKKIFEIDKKI